MGLLALQRAAGNRAVAALMQPRALPTETSARASVPTRPARAPMAGRQPTSPSAPRMRPGPDILEPGKSEPAGPAEPATSGESSAVLDSLTAADSGSSQSPATNGSSGSADSPGAGSNPSTDAPGSGASPRPSIWVEPAFLAEAAERSASSQMTASRGPVELESSGSGARSHSPAVQRGLGLFDTIAGGVAGLAGGVRDRVLQTMSGYARRLPGYQLLCTVLGRDVVAGTPVPRSAAAIIRGFLGLMPRGEELGSQLQQSGAIDRAGTWFEQEIPRLGITWEVIRGLFTRAWDALGAGDLLSPARAWDRIAGLFAPPLARLRDFAVSAATKVAEFVFEGAMAMAGGAGAQVMGVIRRAGDVFNQILRDPIAFARNLIEAIRGGLGGFLTNIGAHLRNGLIGWLTGSLGSVIHLPERFDLRGILGMAMEFLGLTWANIRARIVRLIGERAMGLLERGVDFVRDVVQRGIGALTGRIAQFTSGLVDTVLGGIRDWVANSVVGAAITRLISMFNPAGAVIQAIIAIYNTVQFVIERGRQLGALASSIFDSIAAIARGSIGNAVNAVETALGRAVPVVLGFLARLIGLGDVAAPVRNVMTRVRAVIDSAIDRVVGWIAAMARRARRLGGGRVQPTESDTRTVREKQAALDAAFRDVQNIVVTRQIPVSQLASLLPPIERRHRLRSLRVVDGSVRGTINPTRTWTPPPPGTTAGTGGVLLTGERPVTPAGVRNIAIRGQLLPGIPRASAPNFNTAMPAIATLPAPVRHYVQGYEWAHVWGPGFGDESSQGLMLASGNVNRRHQSLARLHGIEGWLRRVGDAVRAQGGSVELAIFAVSYPDPPTGVPSPLGVPVLRQVDYRVIVDLHGEEFHGESRVICGVPLPNGTGGQGWSYNAGLINMANSLARHGIHVSGVF
jgi:Bacterial toxin 4